MNWLDGEECGSGAEHCNEHPVYVSNWRITSNGMPVPTPPTPAPKPTPPSPHPKPTPGGRSGDGMKCCWGDGCSGCDNDPGSWCNQAEDRCKGSCGGKWLQC